MNKLLYLINTQEMIKFMGIFYKCIIETYLQYADSKTAQMDFKQFVCFCKDHELYPEKQFVCFCKDHELYPELAPKSTLFNIFHSLSLTKDEAPQLPLNQSRIQLSKSIIVSGTCQQNKIEYIDENLFVEILTILTMYNNTENIL
eukprot:CAMPEP_0116872704 /NCGR_PEP_ID=MMETSP0463-20121206/3530_1 /TAXON_ID=181622 /ORGANISM="Strombidinopsis sp, Strain SopsisLIS2011" /LENGTH=144 /DNA_ID=CAMNT_0004513343 /DNA_START=426 /DNA_END=860 /DNA_ORIENTATION=-